MKKTTVIFDMDGVLFDSEKMYIQHLIDFFKKYDIDITFEDGLQFVGIDNKKYYDLAFQFWKNKTSKETFEIILKDYLHTVERNYSLIIRENVIELLDYLKNNGYKIALASSSRIELINEALESANILFYFDLITSGTAFKESKPNPEIYLYTIDKMHVTKDETIIIEDSFPGILAAKNAGIDVVAIYDEKYKINQNQANYIINDIIDIKKYI